MEPINGESPWELRMYANILLPMLGANYLLEFNDYPEMRNIIRDTEIFCSDSWPDE